MGSILIQENLVNFMEFWKVRQTWRKMVKRVKNSRELLWWKYWWIFRKPKLKSLFTCTLLKTKNFDRAYFGRNSPQIMKNKFIIHIIVDCTTLGIILQDLCGIKSVHYVVSSPKYHHIIELVMLYCRDYE